MSQIDRLAWLSWRASVFVARWLTRASYVHRVSRVYRNWWAVLLAKAGMPVTLELRTGLRFHVRPGTTDLGVLNEAFLLDPYFSAGYIRVAPDAIVVDVGANIGDFAIPVAQSCPQGRVIAIEPIAEYAEILRQHAALNGIDNVLCIPTALGSQEGEMVLEVAGVRSRTADGDAGTVQRTPVTRFPTLMRELGVHHIDLLKLDCEGAEWDILPNSEEILPMVDQICMEFHCERGWTAERLAGWLGARGYTVRHTAGAWNGLLWATR